MEHVWEQSAVGECSVTSVEMTFNYMSERIAGTKTERTLDDVGFWRTLLNISLESLRSNF